MRWTIGALAAAALLAGCDRTTSRIDTANTDTVNLPPAEGTPTPALSPAPGQPTTPAPLAGFTHQAGADLFGYYLPTQPVQLGQWKLEALSLGDENEFAKWERGERIATYAPVMLEFADLNSPLQTNELGQEVRSVRIRVLPTAYQVGPGGELRFTATDQRLGAVRFDGVIDTQALATVKKAGPGAAPVTVVTGALTLGTTPFQNLAFTWFGGD